MPPVPYNEDHVTYFALTDARNKKEPFGIKAKDRTRHVYVIGKTGMGKSTLLENMAIQDIQNGEGLAFLDPHGKTAELLLDYVPEHRLKDVLYFAPFDIDFPVAFNVMEDVGPDKRHLVVSGLMSAFKKIWVDAWSARMEYILQNTLLALLEYPGSTLLGINKMLSDKEYRKKVVDNIKDPTVRSFWVDEFSKYTERFAAEATPAIQNKVGQFTSNPLIRNIIGQQKSSFDIRQMMDERKIIIVNLSKGKVGEGNANLLGSMIVTKIYLAAMSRADVSESVMRTLPNFYLYVDEFQSFANESFADILSEARKYKLNLTIAHQYIEQMSEEVQAAVFGNVGTMVSFRVGALDSEVMEKEFAPKFTAEDMVNLGFAQIYLKLMIDGVSSQPFSATTLPPIAPPNDSFKENIIASSQEQFGRPRALVEELIRDQMFGEATKSPIGGKASLGSGNARTPTSTLSIRRPPTITELPRQKSSMDALRATLTSVMKEEVVVSKSINTEIPARPPVSPPSPRSASVSTSPPTRISGASVNPPRAFILKTPAGEPRPGTVFSNRSGFTPPRPPSENFSRPNRPVSRPQTPARDGGSSNTTKAAPPRDVDSGAEGKEGLRGILNLLVKKEQRGEEKKVAPVNRPITPPSIQPASPAPKRASSSILNSLSSSDTKSGHVESQPQTEPPAKPSPQEIPEDKLRAMLAVDSPEKPS